MEEGYGKARRGRRQRAGPYSRPARPPAPAPEEEEARELAQLAPGEPERQGLLASLLQRGASLITKVRQRAGLREPPPRLHGVSVPLVRRADGLEPPPTPCRCLCLAATLRRPPPLNRRQVGTAVLLLMPPTRAEHV